MANVEISTGWERARRTHFDEIVANYDKMRWDYPDELFEDILKYSGSEKNKKALEIGAGTGKATIPFLNAGYDVTAVEMGVNMTAFLLDKFKGQNNFNVITSTFENVSLDDDSYDLVYAASAFHWVDAEIGCPKVFCLLKSGGVFALFRVVTTVSDNKDLYEEIQSAYRKYYHKPYKKPVQPSLEDLMGRTEILKSYGFEDMESYGFSDVTMKLYEATLTYSADEYIALLDTMSDHRALPDDDRANLYAEIKEAVLRHGGRYEQEYIFQLYMGRKI